MRAALREIFTHTIDALDIRHALDLARPRIESALGGCDPARVRLVAFGKAAVPMTDWFVEAIGAASGLVAAPSCAPDRWPGVRGFDAGHPTPNRESLRAGARALALAKQAGDGDVVVFLVSGGGSALLECPLAPAVALEDMRVLNRVLVSCGAGIVEMNTVRKHVSAVKGGRLARAAAPAQQVTVYISDVPAGHECNVASGPTMPDDTTCDDARRVVDAYDLGASLPRSLRALLDDPALPETPKPGDACFARSVWIRLMANRDAMRAAARLCEERGWRVTVEDSVDDIPVAEGAQKLLDVLRRAMRAGGERPVCVIAGGELSSPVVGDGVGGRNQAFVLECVARIAGERIAVLSAGTDGIDGNSPAAGAVADGSTLERAHAAGMEPAEYQARSDAYRFFHRLGDDITSGATQNNVRDIRVLVGWPEGEGGV